MTTLQQTATQQVALLESKGPLARRTAAQFETDFQFMFDHMAPGATLRAMPPDRDGQPRFMVEHRRPSVLARVTTLLRRRQRAGLGIVAVEAIGCATMRLLTLDRHFWRRWYDLPDMEAAE